MEVDGHKFKRVPHFKYLGSIIAQDNNLEIKVWYNRWQMGNRCCYGLKRVC